MRRSPVPLLRAEAVLTRPAPALVPAPARAEAHKAVVRRFYAGVNAALETGDVAPLMAVVAPDFVAHAPRPWWPPGRASLARELRALRAAAPGLRLTPTTLLADGDQVVAQVAEAPPPVSFLGLPLPARAALWGAIDRFRVDGGRVAEHWGTPDRAWLEPMARTPLRLDPPGWRATTLERRTLAAGARDEVRAAGPRLLVAEGGRIAVAVASGSPAAPVVVTWAGGTGAAAEVQAAPRPIPIGTEVALEPGQVVLFATGARATVRNAGRTAATTLEASLSPPAAGAGFDHASPAAGAASPRGIVRTPLAGDVTAPLPVGDAVLAVGRIVLAPGAEVPTHRATGPELLAVEAGALEVTTGEGRAWGRLDPAGSRTLEPRTALASGQGVFVEPGAAAASRNAGDAPLVLLIATLTPAGPPAGSSPAATPPPPGHASPAPTEALPAHW